MAYGGLVAYTLSKLYQSPDKEFVQFIGYGQEGFTHSHQKLNGHSDITIEHAGRLLLT